MKRWMVLILAVSAGGCVTVQGGDKPIKIDVTVTHKIDQQLEQFYSFEKKYDPNASTQPAQPSTPPTTNPGGA